MNKVLAKYNFSIAIEEIDKSILTIQSNLDYWNKPETLIKSFSFIDLTSLNSTDTSESIGNMVKKLNSFQDSFPEYPNPAAICTYSAFAKSIKDGVTKTDISIAVVAGGFPAPQIPLEAKIAECKKAVEDGADEIDIVLPLHYFLAGEYDNVSQEIRSIRESIPAHITLKVILETGALISPENIAAASFLAMESGADFIKTSTGKLEPGATPVAIFTMCKAIAGFYKVTGRRVGIKASGGVKSAMDTVSYYAIVQNTLGEDWLNRDLFRFGASKVANNILSELEQKTINYF